MQINPQPQNYPLTPGMRTTFIYTNDFISSLVLTLQPPPPHKKNKTAPCWLKREHCMLLLPTVVNKASIYTHFILQIALDSSPLITEGIYRFLSIQRFTPRGNNRRYFVQIMSGRGGERDTHTHTHTDFPPT